VDISARLNANCQEEVMPDNNIKDARQAESGGEKSEKARGNKIYPTVIVAMVCASFLAQKHLGAIMPVAFFVLLIWGGCSIFAAVRNSGMKKFYLARVLVWCAAFVFVIMTHHIQDEIARNYANDIVTKVRDFSVVHGRCPETLAEIGVDRQKFKEALGGSGYVCVDGYPYLFYTIPGSIFDRYSYNFKHDIWEFRPD
jgi:hypothetical protein